MNVKCNATALSYPIAILSSTLKPRSATYAIIIHAYAIINLAMNGVRLKLVSWMPIRMLDKLKSVKF